MTGRVCPIHGEWSESGVCRWCEADPVPAKYSRAACDDVSIFQDQEYTFTLAEKTTDAYVYRLTWTAPLYRPPTVEEYAAWLPEKHAALRWERVARRWNRKHRCAGGIDERDRNRVWMHWLDQMNRRYLRLTWKPGEPP